jgi:hypothetical protein
MLLQPGDGAGQSAGLAHAFVHFGPLLLKVKHFRLGTAGSIQAIPVGAQVSRYLGAAAGAASGLPGSGGAASGVPEGLGPGVESVEHAWRPISPVIRLTETSMVSARCIEDSFIRNKFSNYRA